MAVPETLSPEVQALLEQLSGHEAFTDQDVFIHPSSPQYADETKVWSAHRNMSPEVVVKPTKIEQIAPLVQRLYDSELDFSVRNGGIGSASARHVLVSLKNFQGVQLDRSSESAVVGAGAVWGDVGKYFISEAPEWSVVCPRSSFVGVVGSTLIGGLSYLSEEYGLVSDPKNLLDAQIALADGRLIWASEEPSLLWAVRGGRCSFGVITALKLRARRLELNHVYSAWILYPMSKLEEISRAVSKHLSTNEDPNLSMTGYILSPHGLFLPSEPGVAMLVFDRLGTAHARSPEGFKWLFDIEGGREMGKEMTLHEVNSQISDSRSGIYSHFDATGLVDTVDENFVVRAKEWFYSLIETDPALEEASYCLLEFCNRRVFGSTQPEETAWPHGKAKHVLQLGVGYRPENSHLKSLALQKLAEAFQTIPQVPLGGGDYQPTFLETSFMDVKKMYGENYKKLERTADQYDPRRRFRTLFHPDPNFA